MTTPEQRKADRLSRLSMSSHVAAKLRPIVDDHDVSAALDRIESLMVEEMISAQSSDVRDRTAAEIKAWRAMRATLRSLVRSGMDAERKLEQLTKDDT